MRESITQEFDYGCGIACFAFALGMTYRQAAQLLGPTQAASSRFWVKDLTTALNRNGMNYRAKYIKPHLRDKIYDHGTIVLIARSKRYPTGHYLIRYRNLWMDPWINLPYTKDIGKAESGFRKRLPGKPMYAIMPLTAQ